MIYSYYPTISEAEAVAEVCARLNDFLRQTPVSYQSEPRILSFTEDEVKRALTLALYDLDKGDPLSVFVELPAPVTTYNTEAGCKDCITISLPEGVSVSRVLALFEGCATCQQRKAGFELCIPDVQQDEERGNAMLGVRPMCGQCGQRTCGCASSVAAYTVQLAWGYSLATGLWSTNAEGSSNVPRGMGYKFIAPRATAYVLQGVAVRAANLQHQNSAFLGETFEEFAEMLFEQTQLENKQATSTVLLSGDYASS